MGRDFNDVHIDAGPEAVAEAINGAQAPEPEPADIIEAAIAKTAAGDAGALFESEILDALRALAPAQWARTRAHIKRECRDVSVRELDRALRSVDAANDGADDTPATLAVRLARASGEYFFDAERTAYASVQGAQARETWRVDGQGFRDWLAALYYRQTESGLSDQSLQTAINTLRAVALHDGEEHPVGLRVAACPEGGVLIDLGDATWRAVLVTAAGWRILAADHLPVRLYRTAGMQPLPEPVQAAGDIDRLWTHINVPPADRPLLLAWLLDALRPGTPYPVLELCGPQGAAKSSTQRRLRSLIDPHTVPLRGRPRCAEDIFVAAGAGYLVSYENVSGLHPDMQDALCVLATGGGFATRRFYTNAEEAVIRAHRPVVLNGISANATRPDLIDRLVHIALPEITERKTETEIDAAFAADAGAIFGGLLDLFVDALAMLPAVEIAPQELPRLADFALLGEAMHRSSGAQPGAFLDLFGDHRAENMARALDASPLAQAAIGLIEAGQEIIAETAKRAFERLQDFRPQHSDTPFPQSPKSMMDSLRRYAPALRLLGIAVTEHGRTMHGYTLSVRRATHERPPERDMCARGASRKQRNHVHEVHEVHAGGQNGGGHERHELHERKNAPPGTPRAHTHAAADVHSSAGADEGELL